MCVCVWVCVWVCIIDDIKVAGLTAGEGVNKNYKS